MATKKSSKGRRSANKGIAAEKKVAKQMRAKHVGGPGRPDMTRGKKKIEKLLERFL